MSHRLGHLFVGVEAREHALDVMRFADAGIIFVGKAQGPLAGITSQGVGIQAAVVAGAVVHLVRSL